jgi:hypothetical protein
MARRNFHGPPAARMRGIRRAIVRDNPAPSVEPEPVRARDKVGQFVADDPATPEVNEAFVGGKPLKSDWDDTMTKAELLDVATEKGIEGLTMGNTKKQILDALDEAEQ